MPNEVSSVAEKDFHVSLPQVVGGFGWNESEVPSHVREALVIGLLRLDRLSEAQAAAILGVACWELLELMGRYDVPAVRMSAEELDHELATEVKRVTAPNDGLRCRPDHYLSPHHPGARRTLYGDRA
jgi:hypothetical protein